MRYANTHGVPVTPRAARRAGPGAGRGGPRRRDRAGPECDESSARDRRCQHAGLLRAGRRPRPTERRAGAATACSSRPTRLEPHGHCRRHGLDQRPRHARRQVRADQRVGARPRSRPARRPGHREPGFGRLARQAIVSRPGADQADRGCRRHARGRHAPAPEAHWPFRLPAPS